MSIELKIAEVNKIEKKGLSVFEFDGINWWPLIRIYLFQNHKAVNQKESLGLSNRDKLVYPKRILWDIRLWKETRKQLKSYPGAEVYKRLTYVDTCFVTSEINYKLNAENKLINRYLDPLYLETKGSKAIFVNSHKENKDYVISDILPTHYFELELELEKQLNDIINTICFLKKTPTYSKKHETQFTEMIEFIRSFEFFKDFNFAYLGNWIDKTKRFEAIAGRIFQKNRPTQLIQYCYYFPVQFGYTLAANKMGIKTVDYQHGIQNTFHYGYGSWSNVPESGYELLPKEFWVYSKREEQNLLKSFSDSTHEVRIVGNKWVKYWQNHKTSNEDLMWLKTLKHSYKIVLFTISNYLLEEEHFLWEYLKTLKNNSLYILFRLHPGHLYLKEQLMENLKRINYQNYNIDKATTTELYDLLGEVDMHITQNSTVAEEALNFNLSTIILDEKWGIYFEDYINAGDMFLPVNLKEFDSLLNKMLISKH